MHYRFVTFLMATAFFEQVTTALVRVTISYRALELGLSVIWLGVITAAFAILPLVSAVAVGRFIDRGHDARTAWFGGAGQVIACGGLALSHSLPALLIFTALLGIAHLMMVIAQQVLCTRTGGPHDAMDRMLGNYMVANAVGQGVGPAIVGWAGGDASLPPTDLLFWIGLGTSVLAFAAALMLRPGEPHKPRADGSKPVPVREILNMPGIRAIFFVSIVTVAAQDLIVVYLPVLGRERGMSVNDVGTLLAVRAAASMLSRFVYSRLNTIMGRPRLMLISTFASAATYTGLAIPLPLWAMNVVIAGAGFALGVAVTVSIASLLAMSSADLRGTANSLRMMGNRMGQFTIPFIAGLVAAASGAASIFFALGLSLAVAGAVVRVRRPGA